MKKLTRTVAVFVLLIMANTLAITKAEAQPVLEKVSNLTVSFANWNGLLLRWSVPYSVTITWSKSNVPDIRINKIPVVEYDLRISDTPINDLNWSSRQRLAINFAKPDNAGSTRHYRIFPLLPSAKYYLAVKARNANGAWSKMSSLISAETTAVPAVPAVSIKWDSLPELNNRLYYGPTSGVYTNYLNCGQANGCVFTNLAVGEPRFCAATTTRFLIEGEDIIKEYESIRSKEITFAGVPPKISAIANQTTAMNRPVGPIAFTVNDAETPAKDIKLRGASLNKALVSKTNIKIAGRGINRTVTITPTAKQKGDTVIAIIAIDGDGLRSVSTFALKVE